MTGVRQHQLWVAPDTQTYYVIQVHPDATADCCPVFITGTGQDAMAFKKARGVTLRVKTSEMLEKWMPTAPDPSTPPTWHQRILADDD